MEFSFGSSECCCSLLALPQPISLLPRGHWSVWLHLRCTLTSDLLSRPSPSLTLAKRRSTFSSQLPPVVPLVVSSDNRSHGSPLPPSARVRLAAPDLAGRTSPPPVSIRLLVCFSLMLAAIVELYRQQPAICERFIQPERHHGAVRL